MPLPSETIDFVRAVLRELCTPMPGERFDPKASPPYENLLHAARLAATLGSPKRACDLTNPLQVTVVRAPSQYDVDRLAEYAESILAGMTTGCGMNLILDVEIAHSSEPSAYRQSDSLQWGVRAGVARGGGVIAFVYGDRDLSDITRAMPVTELNLIPVTAEIVAEVMRVTSHAPSRALTELLSAQDKGLAAVPYSVILGALRALLRKFRLWDSSHESSVVAGMHEQTHPAELQDQELAGLQRSA